MSAVGHDDHVVLGAAESIANALPVGAAGRNRCTRRCFDDPHEDDGWTAAVGEQCATASLSPLTTFEARPGGSPA